VAKAELKSSALCEAISQVVNNCIIIEKQLNNVKDQTNKQKRDHENGLTSDMLTLSIRTEPLVGASTSKLLFASRPMNAFPDWGWCRKHNGYRGQEDRKTFDEGRE
jgi:hypothetical protein